MLPYQFPSRQRQVVARFVGRAEDFKVIEDEDQKNAAYPNLVRVENLIYHHCVVTEGQREAECLRNWYSLSKFHKDSATECALDDAMCVVLDVLDRLCEGIHESDEIVLLTKVSSMAAAFRARYQEDWRSAFDAADTDGRGDLDCAKFAAALDSVGARMTPAEVRTAFSASDRDEDGVLSREEFSDFLTAAIFAQRPLSRLFAGRVPKTQPDVEGHLRWSTAGRGRSSASVAGLSRVPR